MLAWGAKIEKKKKQGIELALLCPSTNYAMLNVSKDNDNFYIF